MALVGDLLCITGRDEDKLYMLKWATDDFMSQKVVDIEGSCVAAAGKNEIVIANNKRNSLHFVRIRSGLTLDQDTEQSIDMTGLSIRLPKRIVVDEGKKEVIIATSKAITTMNLATKQIGPRCFFPGSDNDTIVPVCALHTEDGNFVMILENKVYWVSNEGSNEGRIIHTVDPAGGDGTASLSDIIQDSQGNLILADTANNRLTLIKKGEPYDTTHYYLPPGNTQPSHLCLDEGSASSDPQLLFVAHSTNSFSTYRWPIWQSDNHIASFDE